MHPGVDQYPGRSTVRGVIDEALLRRIRSRSTWALLAGWVVLVGLALWWSMTSPRQHAPGAAGLLLLLLLVTTFVVPGLGSSSPTFADDGLAGRHVVTLVVGAVLATWLTALVLVAVAAPAVLAVAAADGAAPGRIALGLAVVAALLLTTSAITTACHARRGRRPGAATTLAYACTTALWLGPLVLGAFLQLVLYLPVELPVRLPDAQGKCVTSVQVRSLPRTEVAAWLMAVSTGGVLADAVASPTGGALHATEEGPVDLRNRLHEDRLGPPDVLDMCWPRDQTGAQLDAEWQRRVLESGPMWPYALTAQLALGGAAGAVAVRRASTRDTTRTAA